MSTPPLHRQKSCELHIHTGGCFYPEDLLELGREVYTKVHWEPYIDAYQKAYGTRPDPVALFEDALQNGAAGRERFAHNYVVGPADSGDFARFQAKFNFAVCLYRYWWMVLQREEEVVQRVLDRHRAEGISYIEYRSMAPFGEDDPEGFINFHAANARRISAACQPDFKARYIISLPRWAPEVGYALVQRLFERYPELVPVIIGLDFCFFEEGYPPKGLKSFWQRLEEDNRDRPEQALEVVYHVGESFFDKSLESAVRWCHQAAQLGSRRLGHAIALGLDPQVAVARRPEAHATEPVSERLDQIDYDLAHRSELAAYGVELDPDDLQRQRDELLRRHPEGKVARVYTEQRLEEVRRRQDFVIDQLVELGTVVETCPTSNLRIGDVPAAAHHPIHRFLRSELDLAIGADDPGIFDAPLAGEVDWVGRHAGLDQEQLDQRLGDPRRFRLGRLRAEETSK